MGNQKKLKYAERMGFISMDRVEESADRFQRFIDDSRYVLKTLYNKEDYNPAITKRNFTEKLTKYPEEGNMEYIKSLIELDNGAKNLIIAPTGSGKTYSIDAIFRQMNAESDQKQLLCLLCPNRVQNIQNEKSDKYNFEALVSGVKLDENESDTRQISAVYDKVLEIIRYKENHPDCKLRVVIDECQTLVSANIYRARAVDSIMRLIDKNLADSYTFITATYESMCCFGFDNIVLFEDKNYKPVFRKIDLRYGTQKQFENLVVDTAIKESKPYIRLNDKEMLKKVQATLTNMGQKCYPVTAEEKGSTTNEDGTVTYKNVIFDHIVNNDDLYNNEGEADTIIATSLLDAGTNFTKYSPESTPVFAVCSQNHMNIDEIEQAFNRFRPQKDDTGNVIRLKHAVIIHQVHSSDITKVRIMKRQSDGKMKFVKSILAKNNIIYTDNTTPEDRENGLYDGTITIPGKFLSELEDGVYRLQVVLGKNETFMNYNLYVNCWSDEQPDEDSLNELFTKQVELTMAHWKDKSDRKISNELLEAELAYNDALSGSTAFIYNTGDESSSSQLIFNMTIFKTLTEVLDVYMKRAKEQLRQYHGYEAVGMELQGDEDDIYSEINRQEYLEGFLQRLKDDEPDIGDALFFTNSMKLLIDYRKLFNSVYTTYQRQYYKYPNMLAVELRRRLNVPVSVSYYEPEEYELEEIEEDREAVLQSLNSLYKNPATKEILCSVLHEGNNIPISLDREYSIQMSKVFQSRLYKNEYKLLQNASKSLTFDYIVKALNSLPDEKSTRKYEKRLKYVLFNQAIARGDTLPLATKAMKLQFTEQKTLISVIDDMKKSTGTKKFAVNDSFMDSTRKEFNDRMASGFKGYITKSKTQFKNLLYSVYLVINQNIKSRKPEVTELILDVKDVPFK